MAHGSLHKPVKDKKFYFINKTKASTHLSRSLPIEQAAIQRYVQTGRKRTRNTYKSTTGDVEEAESRDVAETEVQKVVRPKESTSAIAVFEASDANYAPALSLDPTPHRFSLKLDPFEVTSVPLDRAVAGLLHYYLFYHHPSQWPNEMAVLRHGVYMFKDIVLRIVRTAIANKLAMYCLLSSAACRLLFVDRLPCPSVAGSETLYTHKALQLMRSHISNTNLDDTDQLAHTLRCIGFLESAEAYRGNLLAAKAHHDIGVHLLHHKGGLASIKDGNLRGLLAMGDLFLACVNLTPCSFECSYDPGPLANLNLLHKEMEDSSKISSATSLLHRPNSIVPLELRTILEQLVESYIAKTRILTSSMSPSRATEVTHWVTLRNMAIRHKLLAFGSGDPRIHSLRTAVIMWTLLSMNVTGRAKTVKLMAPKLQSIITQIHPNHWAGNEDIRLWILLIGRFCASDGTETAIWFTNEVIQLSTSVLPVNTRLTTRKELGELLEQLQQNFFYDMEVQRAGTNALAHQIYLFYNKAGHEI